MNGRVSKLLRRVAKDSGVTTKSLKKVWKDKNHIERGKIKDYLAVLPQIIQQAKEKQNAANSTTVPAK